MHASSTGRGPGRLRSSRVAFLAVLMAVAIPVASSRAFPPHQSIDSTIAELRAQRIDQATAALDGDNEVVVAIGHVAWPADLTASQRLERTLAASVKARKAAASYLFGLDSKSVTSIATRTESRIDESDTASTTEKTRSRYVEETVAGILQGMRVRTTLVDEDRDRLVVVLISTPDAATPGSATPTFSDEESAARGILDGMCDGSIVPCGGMMIRLANGRPAVAGLGAVPAKNTTPSRAETLIAGRRAAAGLVAFLKGEEITGKDTFSEVFRTVLREDPRRGPTRESEHSRSLDRLAGTMSRGVVPGGNTTGERVATLAGDRYLFSVVVVPVDRN